MPTPDPPGLKGRYQFRKISGCGRLLIGTFEAGFKPGLHGPYRIPAGGRAAGLGPRPRPRGIGRRTPPAARLRTEPGTPLPLPALHRRVVARETDLRDDRALDLSLAPGRARGGYDFLRDPDLTWPRCTEKKSRMVQIADMDDPTADEADMFRSGSRAVRARPMLQDDAPGCTLDCYLHELVRGAQLEAHQAGCPSRSSSFPGRRIKHSASGSASAPTGAFARNSPWCRVQRLFIA